MKKRKDKPLTMWCAWPSTERTPWRATFAFAKFYSRTLAREQGLPGPIVQVEIRRVKPKRKAKKEPTP